MDSAVVEGKKPAVYFSRGDGGAFYSALAAEEELDSKSTTSYRTNEPAGIESSEEEALAADVDTREDERNRKINARGGIPGFP